jgi:uncharacterized protein
MMEKLFIKNRKDQKLSVVLHSPKNATTKIIIISHSFKADKDYDTIGVNFAEKVCSQGYAALRFDCYGSGESEGKFEDSDLFSQKEDLEDVIKFAQKQGYKEIALAGLSQGAAMSILAYTEEIKCLVLWSPALDVRVLYKEYQALFNGNDFIIRTQRRTGKEIKVGKKMWESLGEIKVFEHLSKIKSPTLIVCGSEDLNHIQFVHKYFNDFSCEKKLEIIENADHDFLDPEKEAKAVSLSLSWIGEHL